MHVNLRGVRQFSPSIKRPCSLQGQQPITLRIVSRVGRAVTAAEAGAAVDQVQVNAFPGPGNCTDQSLKLLMAPFSTETGVPS